MLQISVGVWEGGANIKLCPFAVFSLHASEKFIRGESPTLQQIIFIPLVKSPNSKLNDFIRIYDLTALINFQLFISSLIRGFQPIIEFDPTKLIY